MESIFTIFHCAVASKIIKLEPSLSLIKLSMVGVKIVVQIYSGNSHTIRERSLGDP